MAPEARMLDFAFIAGLLVLFAAIYAFSYACSRL